MNKNLLIIIGIIVVVGIVAVFGFVLSSDDGEVSPSTPVEDTASEADSTASDVSESVEATQPEMLPTAKVMIFTPEYLNPEEYVPCTIRVYEDTETNTPAINQQNCEIKIRGNSTSSGDKKPYNIRFPEPTDVLGMGENKKWSLLANCYDPTLIRNQMVYDFAAQSNLLYTPSYRIAEVYLNGKIQGAYILCDPIDSDVTRIDIDNQNNDFVLEYDVREDPDTIYVTTSLCFQRFGIKEPDNPTYEQTKWVKDYLKKAETALTSGSFSQVEKYFDIKTLVDFYIVNEYFKNVDIAVGSTYFYIKDEVIYGGPVWDFDLSSGNSNRYYWNHDEYNNVNGQGNGSENNAQGIYCKKLWFERLWEYKAFRDAVYARYKELQPIIVNLYEDNSLGENYIDRITAAYATTFERNFKNARWSENKQYCEYQRFPEATFEENIEFLRAWLKERNEWLLDEWNIK